MLIFYINKVVKLWEKETQLYQKISYNIMGGKKEMLCDKKCKIMRKKLKLLENKVIKIGEEITIFLTA